MAEQQNDNTSSKLSTNLKNISNTEKKNENYEQITAQPFEDS